MTQSGDNISVRNLLLKDGRVRAQNGEYRSYYLDANNDVQTDDTDTELGLKDAIMVENDFLGEKILSQPVSCMCALPPWEVVTYGGTGQT